MPEIEGPRGAKVDELGEVLDLVNLVFRTSRGMKPTMQEEFPLLFNESNVENLRIIKVNGKVVSHVGIFECDAIIYGCRLKVGMIGSVCTHPDYRRRGFATRLVEDAMNKMRKDGVNIVMISGIRRLYDRAGCAIAGLSYDVYIDQEDVAKIDDTEIEIELDKGNKVDEFIRIYEHESIRYVRPYEHFKTLLSGSAWHASGLIHERYPFLIRMNDEYLAYLIVHKSERSEGRLVEYSGLRTLILPALKKVMKEYGIRGISFKVPWWDFELLTLIRRAGLRISNKSTMINGTMRLLVVDDFLERIKPYIIERLGEYGLNLNIEEVDTDRYIISFKQEKIVLNNPKELAWIIFGIPEEINPRYHEFMPKRELMPKGGELRKVIEKIFPLPSLPYGLYYT